MTNLLYITFGKDINIHLQATFSILTFLNKKKIDKIYVYTDNPDFYKKWNDFIEVIPLEESELIKWKGDFNYTYRIKIMGIKDLINRCPKDNLVFVDSDTFLYGDFSKVLEGLENNNAFMHKEEYILSENKSKKRRRIWKKLKGKTFEGITIDSTQSMWNSGFIAIPAHNNKEIIDQVIRLCDTACAMDLPRVIEQLAFSIVLSKHFSLYETESIIGHYWGNKEEWNQEISNYFCKSYLNNNTINDDLNGINSFNFKKTPIFKRKRNTLIRLESILCNIFKYKKIDYIN